jgi:hypothetical protein
LKSIVFALLALLALIPCAQCMAQTPAAMPLASSVAAATPASVADFLETLSNGQSSAPGTGDQTPSPTLMATSCTTDTECPRGQLCCYPCGIEGCSKICMKPMNGHCPFFP